MDFVNKSLIQITLQCNTTPLFWNTCDSPQQALNQPRSTLAGLNTLGHTHGDSHRNQTAVWVFQPT